MTRRKTHEEYVTEVAVKNPNVEVVGTYVDAKTKIEHRCLIHDVYWDALSGNILKGRGCKECMKEKNREKFVKSHNEYVTQVHNISPHIDVLETYVGSHTPILHYCRTHDIEWRPMPSNILKGYGCVKCGSDKIHDKKCKKHEDYVKELVAKNPNVEVVEKYVDSKTPIMHRCKIHDVCWNITPSGALAGHGCEMCHRERQRNALCKSHNQYVIEAKIANPDIIVIGEYINVITPILHYCTIHNVKWHTSPYNILLGCGCHRCLGEKISEKNAKTHEQYVEELKTLNPTVVPKEKYVDMKTSILHWCSIHNVDWKTSPASVIQGCGCYKCRSEKISNGVRKTHDQYVLDLEIANPNIIVVDNYIDAKTPILHQCLIDGCKWYASPTNILSGGCGCPQCNESKGERLVRQWLEKHNISYKYQMPFDDCRNIKSLPFDFYLLDLNICIEYDGKQHFEPIEYFGGQEAFEIRQKHDQIKTEYCKKNNIKILRIPYFANVEEELNNFLFI